MTKFLFDVFPVIFFFIAYRIAEKFAPESQGLANQLFSQFTTGHNVSLALAPILLATGLAIVASTMQIAYVLLKRKKVEVMLWISFFIITVFGGATIYFQNPDFIKLKPTIIYWCFAASFLLSEYVFKKNILKTAMGSQVTMPDEVWAKLSLAWVAFYCVMGSANYYVAFHFSQDTWVNFKMYSLAALPVFIIGQSFFLAKYLEDPI
ncbi:MAG: septation protein A [Undibacterium sp.]|nr:septation protein A [Undibacterium sp.]